MRGFAHRIDENQPELVSAFRAMGCSVWITSRLGQGAPDLVVRKFSQVRLIEVKNPKKPPSERALTKDEQEFQKAWAPVYHVIETAEQAHQLVAEMTLKERLDGQAG